MPQFHRLTLTTLQTALKAVFRNPVEGDLENLKNKINKFSNLKKATRAPSFPEPVCRDMRISRDILGNAKEVLVRISDEYYKDNSDIRGVNVDLNAVAGLDVPSDADEVT